MKNLLQALGNLVVWYQLSFISFFGILWYGKLPKVSLYHWFNDGCLYSTKGIYENKTQQVLFTKDVSNHVKNDIIDQYIVDLFNDDVFCSNIKGLDIPIFDGRKIIGSQGVITIFMRVKEKTLNSAKNI